jgi:hypothetical protein
VIGFFFRKFRGIKDRKKQRLAASAASSAVVPVPIEELSPEKQQFARSFEQLDDLMNRVSLVCKKTEDKFQRLLKKKVGEADGQKEKEWPKAFFDALEEARDKAVTVGERQVALFPSSGFEKKGNMLNRVVPDAQDVVFSKNASLATKAVALCETAETLEKVLNDMPEKEAFMGSKGKSFSVIRDGIYAIESCVVLLDNDMRWQLRTLSGQLDAYLVDNDELRQKSSMDMKVLGNVCDRYVESLKRMEQLLDCSALRPEGVYSFVLNITRQERFSRQEASKGEIKKGIQQLINTLQRLSERAKQADKFSEFPKPH